MSYLQRFARMLGIGEHQAEDALQSESAARVAIGRRDFIAAGAALAVGTAFSIPEAATEITTLLTWEPGTVLVEIVGPLGFRYSLDSGRTYSAPAPAVGTVVLPGGMSATFAKGVYRPGDRYEVPAPKLRRGRSRA